MHEVDLILEKPVSTSPRIRNYDSHDNSPRSSCWRLGLKALSQQTIFAGFYMDFSLIASPMVVRGKGLSRETNIM